MRGFIALRCSASQQTVNAQMIAEEIKQTKPLSIMMRESIQQLRDWVMHRTVMAD